MLLRCNHIPSTTRFILSLDPPSPCARVIFLKSPRTVVFFLRNFNKNKNLHRKEMTKFSFNVESLVSDEVQAHFLVPFPKLSCFGIVCQPCRSFLVPSRTDVKTAESTKSFRFSYTKILILFEYYHTSRSSPSISESFFLDHLFPTLHAISCI